MTDLDPAAIRLLAPLRAGAPSIWRGAVGGAPAVVKLADDGAPWHDPRSAFYGGAGLVPPFRPLVTHEAIAWRAVDPGRLLAVGHLRGVPCVALRHLPGARPRPGGVGAVEPLLRAVCRALDPLHRAGVVHRDLRPANLLVDGDAVHLIDLDVALVGGLGPLGVGRRRWRAPELCEAPGDPRSDLYALGRLARWTLGLEPGAPLPRRCPRRDLVAALLAPDPADRPADLAEVRAALGDPGPPMPPCPPPLARPPGHDPIALERALIAGDPWRIIEAIDAAPFDPPAVGAITGRLLAGAARGGGERWLLVAAACALLAERRRSADAELHARQAREARLRAGEPWHPAHGALGRLLDGGGDRAARVDDLCRLHRYASAHAHARREPVPTARVAWWRGDTPGLVSALAAADPGDPRARALAAAEATLRAPSRAAAVAADLPADLRLAIARRARPADAAAVAAALGDRADPAARRARLAAALHAGDAAAAAAAAAGLADAGHLDPTVAACLAVFDAPGPRRARAEAIIAARLPDLEPARAVALDRLARDPADAEALALLVDVERRRGAPERDPLTASLRTLLGRAPARPADPRPADPIAGGRPR